MRLPFLPRHFSTRAVISGLVVVQVLHIILAFLESVTVYVKVITFIITFFFYGISNILSKSFNSNCIL
jgi:hypothetical protein